MIPTDDELRSIAEGIETRRLLSGLSIRKAAGLAGISPTWWKAVISGEGRADPETLREMAYVVGWGTQVADRLGLDHRRRSSTGAATEKRATKREGWLADLRRKIYSLPGVADPDKLAALRVIEEAEAYQPPGDELYEDGWTPEKPPGEEPGGQ